MKVEITKQEAWRILDSIIAYKDDYELSTAVKTTIRSIEKKMKRIVTVSYTHLTLPTIRMV